MSNSLRKPALLSIFAAMLAVVPCAQALDWKLWNHKPGKSRTARDLEAARTLMLGEFTGSTADTAVAALNKRLTLGDDVRLVDKAPRYTLSGKSVGGRIDAKLIERSGKVLFERTYAAPGIDDNAKALVDDVLYVVTGRQGVASSQIAFVSDVSGTKQVYVCDADGSNIEQVTHSRRGAVAPAISQDFLAYTAYSTGFPCVMLVELGGGAERQLTSTPGLSSGLAFAPDARRVALTMSFVGNPEIFVLDLPTSHAVCVTESIGTPSNPAWHPDGKRIIFSSNEGEGPQLYIVESDTEKPAVRWSCGYSFATDPEWSPDGRQVAFTARIGADFAVVTRPFNGFGSKVLQRNAQHPTWSPDGTSIAYVQNGQLWIQDVGSKRRHSIVSGRGEISEPRWMR